MNDYLHRDPPGVPGDPSVFCFMDFFAYYQLKPGVLITSEGEMLGAAPSPVTLKFTVKVFPEPSRAVNINL